MVDLLTLDFLAGVVLGTVVLAPGSYFGFRAARRWLARHRAGIPQTAHARIMTRRSRRSAPTSPVLTHAVEDMETRLAVTWAEFRRRHLRGGM